MKTIRYIFIICLALASSSCITTQYSTDDTVTVNAYSDDISYNLDLQAVAAAFGEARNLEEFEYMINDYNSQISNLDLNQDGYVDYLRVVEATDHNANVILIQAVLGQNIYQDVASIIAERRGTQNVHVQFVGNSYLYGQDYFFTPVFINRPPIYSYFWTPRTVLWSSPYYWGYYPTFYHAHAPLRRSAYYSHINTYLGNCQYYSRARYNRNIYYSGYNDLHRSISRNDYSTRYPENSFARRVSTRSSSATSSSSSRSTSIRNASQLPETRGTSATRSSSTRNSSDEMTNRRSSSSTRSSNASTRSDNNSGTTRSRSDSSNTRSSGTSTRSSDSSTRSNSTSTRSSNSSNTRSSGTSTRSSNSSTRSNSTSTRSSNSSNTRSSGTSTRSSNSSTRSNSTSTRSSNSSNTRSSSNSSSSRSSGRTR